jgi:hypothetical protein
MINKDISTDLNCKENIEILSTFIGNSQASYKHAGEFDRRLPRLNQKTLEKLSSELIWVDQLYKKTISCEDYRWDKPPIGNRILKSLSYSKIKLRSENAKLLDIRSAFSNQSQVIEQIIEKRFMKLMKELQVKDEYEHEKNFEDWRNDVLNHFNSQIDQTISVSLSGSYLNNMKAQTNTKRTLDQIIDDQSNIKSVSNKQKKGLNNEPN